MYVHGICFILFDARVMDAASSGEAKKKIDGSLKEIIIYKLKI